MIVTAPAISLFVTLVAVVKASTPPIIHEFRKPVGVRPSSSRNKGQILMQLYNNDNNNNNNGAVRLSDVPWPPTFEVQIDDDQDEISPIDDIIVVNIQDSSNSLKPDDHSINHSQQQLPKSVIDEFELPSMRSILPRLFDDHFSHGGHLIIPPCDPRRMPREERDDPSLGPVQDIGSVVLMAPFKVRAKVSSLGPEMGGMLQLQVPMFFGTPILDSLPFAGIADAASFDTTEQLEASFPEFISICHPNWRGIRAATYGQGNAVLEIREIVSRHHSRRLVAFLCGIQSLRGLIVNGIPGGMLGFSEELRADCPRVRIYFIYHGSMAQDFHRHEAALVNTMIDLAKRRVIDRVGVVKNGMAASFRAFGVDAVEVWNFPVRNARPESTENGFLRDDRWNIGIFGSHELHKNIITQILASCHFSNAVIWVRNIPDIPYLAHCRASIKSTGYIPPDQFYKLLARMHVTLYVSLTEAFPMTVLESISLGIPAIVSPTSAVYDVDPEVAKELTVIHLDSPDAIADRIFHVISNYEHITSLLETLPEKISHESHRLWEKFLSLDN
eukprot:Partr_v1_DN28014_c1_g1_i1_m57094